MHKVVFRLPSTPRVPPPHLLCLRTCTRHVSSLPLSTRAAADLIRTIRSTQFANISDKAELARAVDTSMRDFLLIASSNQRSTINVLDVIGQIKLCRKSKQPFRIAEIWPHIQQLSLLPAKDEKTSRALIGSVLSSALEAKDTATAASVCKFLCASPRLPLEEAHVVQLLAALRGRPDLVVEVITAVQQGSLSVRVEAKFFNAALQALVDAPEEAKRVFELASTHKMVNAVTLVVWCQVLHRRDLDGALNTLSIADSLSITPQPAHYTVLLSCAADMKSLSATKRIHQHLLSHPTASAHRDPIVTGALMHSYAQCGGLETAVAVFEEGLRSGVRFAVEQWNCLLSGYTKHGMLKEAQATLERMAAVGVAADAVTYTVLLSLAADMHDLSATKRIHQQLIDNPPACDNVATGALMHSYAQCGQLETAVAVFEAGLRRGLRFDVTGWTVLLRAYTEHGMFNEAQATLERMAAAGVAADEVTVLCLLNAASHAGLGLGARQLYDQIQLRFPNLQLGSLHRSCVVDALARAGLLDEAAAEARALEHDVAWMAVLGGARSHGRLDIGELALKEIRRLDTNNETLASAHVLMSHIYTTHGRDEDAAQMRQCMKNERLHKLPGESCIEVSGVMHTFRVGDTSHPEMQQIIALNENLHERMRDAGYVPDISWASRDASMPDETKAQLLCEHSERLALVYGLLHSAEEGQPLTIFKNLRVCGDCHNATKHASKVVGRKLMVKDANRWHVFEEGKCSCGDFW